MYLSICIILITNQTICPDKYNIVQSSAILTEKWKIDQSSGILSGQVQYCPVKCNIVRTSGILSSQVQYCLDKWNIVQSSAILSGQVEYCPDKVWKMANCWIYIISCTEHCSIFTHSWTDYIIFHVISAFICHTVPILPRFTSSSNTLSPKSNLQCCKFHPNGNYIATGSCDRSVRLWDVINGQCCRIFTGHKVVITI